VRWHGVRLVQDVPPGGLPFDAFYERRLGSPEAVRLRQAQVQAAASDAGIRIAFERIARFPDSAPAHRLYRLGAELLDTSASDALMQRLFEAYFQRGEDIGDRSTLTGIGLEAGLPAEIVARTLEANNAPAPMTPPSVPYFLFQQSVAVSGAQSVQHLLEAMRQAFRTSPVNT